MDIHAESATIIPNGVAHATLFYPSAGSLASGSTREPSEGVAAAATPSRVVGDDHGSVHGTVLTENLTK
jgi:hypothetical protein